MDARIYDARIYIERRALIAGFGALLITSQLPRPVPQTAKVVKVVCVCNHQDATWVVFDDEPTTIWRLEEDFTVKNGMEFLA